MMEMEPSQPVGSAERANEPAKPATRLPGRRSEAGFLGLAMRSDAAGASSVQLELRVGSSSESSLATLNTLDAICMVIRRRLGPIGASGLDSAELAINRHEPTEPSRRPYRDRRQGPAATGRPQNPNWVAEDANCRLVVTSRGAPRGARTKTYHGYVVDL